jgi:hypothetical protein
MTTRPLTTWLVRKEVGLLAEYIDDTFDAVLKENLYYIPIATREQVKAGTDDGCLVWMGRYNPDMTVTITDGEGKERDVRTVMWEKHHHRKVPTGSTVKSVCHFFGEGCLAGDHAKLTTRGILDSPVKSLSEEQLKMFHVDARTMGISKLAAKWGISPTTARRYMGRIK